MQFPEEVISTMLLWNSAVSQRARYQTYIQLICKASLFLMCYSDVHQHSVAYVYKRGRRKTYSLVVCNNSVLQKTIPWIVVPYVCNHIDSQHIAPGKELRCRTSC